MDAIIGSKTTADMAFGLRRKMAHRTPGWLVALATWEQPLEVWPRLVPKIVAFVAKSGNIPIPLGNGKSVLILSWWSMVYARQCVIFEANTIFIRIILEYFLIWWSFAQFDYFVKRHRKNWHMKFCYQNIAGKPTKNTDSLWFLDPSFLHDFRRLHHLRFLPFSVTFGWMLEDGSPILSLALFDPMRVQIEGMSLNSFSVATHIVRIDPGLW